MAGRLVRGLGKNLFLRSNDSFGSVSQGNADDVKMLIDKANIDGHQSAQFSASCEGGGRRLIEPRLVEEPEES